MRFLTEVVGNGTRQANGCYGTLMARIKYRTTTFGGITHVGEERISRASATPLQPGPQRFPLPNFGVPFYLYVHPLSQNYQI